MSILKYIYIPSSHVVDKGAVVYGEKTVDVDENEDGGSGVHRYVGGEGTVLHP